MKIYRESVADETDHITYGVVLTSILLKFTADAILFRKSQSNIFFISIRFNINFGC